MDPSKFPSRYSYTGESHSGGQAIVYICHDTFLERKVAIKVFSDGCGNTDVNVEATALKSISSNHVVEIYDVISVSGVSLPALVQEYVGGTLISDHDTLDIIGLTNYFQLLYQIALGIDDIHKMDFVHRDIKPQNMRLTNEGILKLLDFGISSLVAPPETTLYSRGTNGFRAPELYSPPIEITSKVDVYAFGVTAWYLATGTLSPGMMEFPPYKHNTTPDFSTIRPDFPVKIAAIFNSCIAINPDERPAMSEVVKAIYAQLTFGLHNAQMVLDGRTFTFDKVGGLVRLHAEGLGTVKIKYTGLDFVISEQNASVFFNNAGLADGSAVPNSCVITLGPHSAKHYRKFCAFNVSHPEVVI